MLRSSDICAEFGSGRSTLWLARRCAHLTSVEHDEQWHAKVSRTIAAEGITNVRYLCHLREEPDATGYRSTYAAVAQSLRDESIDVALVDGLYRDYVTLALLPKIRPGGLIVIDNVNRYLPSLTTSPGSIRPPAARDGHMGAGSHGSCPMATDLDQQRRLGHGDLREGAEGWAPPVRRQRVNETPMYTDGCYLSKNPGWHEHDAAWKASQVLAFLDDRKLRPESIVDIGCGTGGVLEVIASIWQGTRLAGYDPSPDAIRMFRRSSRIALNVGTPLDVREHYDLLLSLDVFEHIEDYIGFLRSLRPIADWFMFHIPLDTSAQSVIRERPLLAARSTVGHLHYFTRGTALASLETAGFKIVCDKLLFPNTLPNRRTKTRIANIPRNLGQHFRPELSARILGGSTLLVLASVPPAEKRLRHVRVAADDRPRSPRSPCGARPPRGRPAQPAHVGLGQRGQVGGRRGSWHRWPTMARSSAIGRRRRASATV